MKTVRIVQIKPLPKRSRLPALKKAPLKKLLSKDDTRIVTPKSVAGGSVASEEARKRDHRSFSRMYKGKPDILKRYKTSVRTKTLDTPRLKIKPRKGKAREVRLLRSESMIREAVLARRLLTDKTHQARSYHTLYARTRAALRGSLTARNLKQFEALPTPAKLADQSLKKIDKAIIELARYVMVLVSHKVESKPPNYPDACTDEEGHGFGGDMTPSTGSTPNPVGLLQNNWWPLKWYTTCVRDQGGRGACTAFGIVAAVESAVAAKHQRWINLSEQVILRDVVFQAEIIKQCILVRRKLPHHRCESSSEITGHHYPMCTDQLGVFQHNRPESVIPRMHRIPRLNG